MSILMSKENPDGYKLEELLPLIATEIELKSEKIMSDSSSTAQSVVNNNGQIIGLLKQAEHIQKQSFVLMSSIRDDEGPNGKPRIGEGS